MMLNKQGPATLQRHWASNPQPYTTMLEDCGQTTRPGKQIKKAKTPEQIAAAKEYFKRRYQEKKHLIKEKATPLTPEQKERRKENYAKWKAKNKEGWTEYQKQYHLLNRAKRNAANAGYAKANREKVREYHREWTEKNREQVRETRRSRTRLRKETDVEFVLRLSLRKRLKGALLAKNAEKQLKAVDLVGCSIPALKKHLEAQFIKGMSWSNWGNDGWHVDHIVPCAAFDLSCVEQQKKCFHFSNLRPLWAKDNLIKNDKIITCQPELLLSLV